MIKIEQEGAIIKILLDRPERRNAFSRDLTSALAAAVEDAAADPSCRLIWVSSTSGSFSSGRDLSDTKSEGRTDLLQQGTVPTTSHCGRRGKARGGVRLFQVHFATVWFPDSVRSISQGERWQDM